MRSFEIALLELKRLVSARPFRLAVVVVCLVPLLYGVLYLWAFWDPYKRWTSCPSHWSSKTARRSPTVRRSTSGRTSPPSCARARRFDWQTVLRRQAADGVQSGKYYMSLTVPRDFSARLAHADSDHPRRARLLVRANEGPTCLPARSASACSSEVQSSLSRVTSRKYLDRVFVGLGDARTGLERAGSGAGRLASALGSASSGSRTLARGLGGARAGRSPAAQRAEPAVVGRREAPQRRGLGGDRSRPPRGRRACRR